MILTKSAISSPSGPATSSGNGRHLKSNFLAVLVVLLFSQTGAMAGELYTERELWAAGEMWLETQVQWRGEVKAYQERLQSIEAQAIPEATKKRLRTAEVARHQSRSQSLAGKRDQVQNILVNEANARTRTGNTATSESLTNTAGTQFGEPGHRGMAGDRDMGGGERTVQKVREVLADMGIDGAMPIKSTAGTLEIGGDFELTINKSGLCPRAGSEFHRIKTNIDARNPETYVSESMKQRDFDKKLVKKQVGTDYVEIQDHKKKASEGLASDGDALAKSPKKMQKMAKGTVKTLEMKTIDDKVVETILKQNGIKESPDAFRDRLTEMKEGGIGCSDPVEAERLRRASEDIFNASEAKAFDNAKREIVELREQAAKLETNDPRRRAINDEIVDSVTKMKATSQANDDFLQTKKGPGQPEAPKATTTATVDGDLASIKPTAKARAAAAFGAIMTITDIGQSCQTLEDYVDGKIALGDATLKVVDQFATGGLIATTENAKHSYDDYSAAQKDTDTANRNNLTAYLTAWENQFRKAGVAPGEARRYVAAAVLAGNLDGLEAKAAELAAKGRSIKPPTLIVEDFHGDDTVAERSYNLGKGFLQGIGDGVGYIITAPGRTVEALGQRELTEADINAKADTMESATKVEIFRKLFNAGIDSKRILDAYAEWEAGKVTSLRELVREAHSAREASEPTPEELAAAAAAIEAEAMQRETGIRRANACAAYLRFAPLTLSVDPAPVEIAAEGTRVLIDLALTGGSMEQAARQLEEALRAISGAQAQVKLTYTFSCQGKPGNSPAAWRTASPALPGTYPVTATMAVQISGLSDPYQPLMRTFRRSVTTPIKVAVNPAKQKVEGEIWDCLKQMSVIVITHPLRTFRSPCKPGTSIVFPVDYRSSFTPGFRITGRGVATISADGKSISLTWNETFTDMDTGRVSGTDEYRVGPFRYDSHIIPKKTNEGQVYYVMDRERSGDFGSCKTTSFFVNGSESAQKVFDRHSPEAQMYIHFYQSDEEIAACRAASKK